MEDLPKKGGGGICAHPLFSAYSVALRNFSKSLKLRIRKPTILLDMIAIGSDAILPNMLYQPLGSRYDRKKPCPIFRRQPLKTQPAPNIILLGTFFGTTLVASRFSVGQMSSLTYVGLRLSLAALGFLIIYLLPNSKRTWPRGNDIWQHGIILGIFGTALPMVSFVSSLQFISSGLTSVLMTTSPAITAILAHILLPDEKLTIKRGVGVILAFIGALLLTVRGESGIAGLTRANPLGYIFVFSGIFSANIMSIYIRKKMRGYSTFDVGVIRMITSSLVVLPLAWLVSGLDISRVDSMGWTVLVYTAIIGTFFAMMLDFANIKRFGATISSMVTFVIPIVAVVCGAIFLGEQTTSSMLAGMLMIIAGVWVIIRSQNKRELPL